MQPTFSTSQEQEGETNDDGDHSNDPAKLEPVDSDTLYLVETLTNAATTNRTVVVARASSSPALLGGGGGGKGNSSTHNYDGQRLQPPAPVYGGGFGSSGSQCPSAAASPNLVAISTFTTVSDNGLTSFNNNISNTSPFLQHSLYDPQHDPQFHSHNNSSVYQQHHHQQQHHSHPRHHHQQNDKQCYPHSSRGTPHCASGRRGTNANGNGNGHGEGHGSGGGGLLTGGGRDQYHSHTLYKRKKQSVVGSAAVGLRRAGCWGGDPLTSPSSSPSASPEFQIAGGGGGVTNGGTNQSRQRSNTNTTSRPGNDIFADLHSDIRLQSPVTMYLGHGEWGPRAVALTDTHLLIATPDGRRDSMELASFRNIKFKKPEVLPFSPSSGGGGGMGRGGEESGVQGEGGYDSTASTPKSSPRGARSPYSRSNRGSVARSRSSLSMLRRGTTSNTNTHHQLATAVHRSRSRSRSGSRFRDRSRSRAGSVFAQASSSTFQPQSHASAQQPPATTRGFPEMKFKLPQENWAITLRVSDEGVLQEWAKELQAVYWRRAEAFTINLNREGGSS